MSLKKILAPALIVLAFAASSSAISAVPTTENGVTTIHLDEHNGYFAAQETLVDLKPGEYEFVVSNKTDKVVGFWLQDAKSQAFLDKFPLEPGKTHSTRVKISENGFRYRCPINPTPWYEVEVSK